MINIGGPGGNAFWRSVGSFFRRHYAFYIPVVVLGVVGCVFCVGHAGYVAAVFSKENLAAVYGQLFPGIVPVLAFALASGLLAGKGTQPAARVVYPGSLSWQLVIAKMKAIWDHPGVKLQARFLIALLWQASEVWPTIWWAIFVVALATWVILQSRNATAMCLLAPLFGVAAGVAGGQIIHTVVWLIVLLAYFCSMTIVGWKKRVLASIRQDLD